MESGCSDHVGRRTFPRYTVINFDYLEHNKVQSYVNNIQLSSSTLVGNTIANAKDRYITV